MGTSLVVVVKNLPCNAGDLGLIPDWRTEIPHALRQLSTERKDSTCHNEDHYSQINNYLKKVAGSYCGEIGG